MSKKEPIALSLNFELETDEERTQFLHDYISKNPNISPSELEMLANYALWGRNKETERNNIEEGYILEPAKKTVWKKPKETSLEALLEGIRPQTIYPLSAENTYKIPSPRPFSRDEARLEAPSSTLRAMEELWERIDQLDYEIQLYDIRQKNRTELSKDFSHIDTVNGAKRSAKMTHVDRREKYRLLVEMRREQYTYRDTYKPTARRRTIDHFSHTSSLVICAHPFDITKFPDPSLFQLPLQSCAKRPTQQEATPGFYPTCEGEVPIDLTDPSIVTPLLSKLSLISDLSLLDDDPLHSLQKFNNLIKYYISQMILSPEHKRILELRTETDLSLREVQSIIKQEFNKDYNINYLSTLYTKKFVPHFIEIVNVHTTVMRNLDNPAFFQTCRLCGDTKPLDPLFYTVNRRLKSGYSTSCKICEKKARDAAKENHE